MELIVKGGFSCLAMRGIRAAGVLLALSLRLTAFGQFSLDDLIFETVATVPQPTSIKSANDGSGRMFLLSQTGQIRVFDGQQVLPTLFLDVGDLVSCCGERGLLDIEFHPNFGSNGLFYINYTDAQEDTVVARYRVSADPNVADASSAETVLTIDQPSKEHNAGQMHFGRDGFLYIATGDGGGSGDPDQLGQSLGTLLGKILRIDVDSGDPYAVPPSNPFVGQEGARDEIWALGFRNPWRFSFDRMTGDMYIADVGQAYKEEIDFAPGTSPGGENYGWSIMEGSICFDPDDTRPANPVPAEVCNDGSLVMPLFDYTHVRPSSCGGSVTGGYVYRGTRFPEMAGWYFFADFCQAKLYALRQESGMAPAMQEREVNLGVSTFGEGEDGELYLADFGSGQISRLSLERPLPTLTRIDPRATFAGGGDFRMTLAGSGFVGDSQVWWNGDRRPTRFVDNTRVQVTISEEDIAAAGPAEVTVFTPAPGGGQSDHVTFAVELLPPVSPRVNAGGVVNAATFGAGSPVAPGSLASVFGVEMTPATRLALLRPLTTSLGGATISFEHGGAAALTPSGVLQPGPIPVPLIFASALQFNVQIPWELAGLEQATLTLRVGEFESDPVEVSLAPHAPGLFSVDQSGTGQGRFLIANTLGVVPAPVGFAPGILESRPIRRGEFMEMFVTGLGPVEEPPVTGSGGARPLSRTTQQPRVTIGGVDGEVGFSGLTQFVGLYQVNVRLAQETPSGIAVPVVLTIGGVESNTVTIAVE